MNCKEICELIDKTLEEYEQEKRDNARDKLERRSTIGLVSSPGDDCSFSFGSDSTSSVLPALGRTS